MKWKERVAVAMAISVVLLTSVLVLDIGYAQHGESPGFIIPALRHGQSRLKTGKQFQNQFLDNSKQTEAPDSVSTTAAAAASTAAGAAEAVTVSNNINNEDRYYCKDFMLDSRLIAFRS